MTDHYEMPHARADECPHAGVGKACRPCRDRFERAPITPDELAAMRRLALTTPQTPGEHAYVEHVPRLLDALATAEAERDQARAEVARLRSEILTLVTATGSDVSCGGLSIADEGCFAGDLARRIRAVVYSPGEPRAARPAPVWDEDTEFEAVDAARVAVRMALADAPEAPADVIAAHASRAILAVVREHLPVSGESRATVQAEALLDAAEEIDRLYFGPDQDRPFSTGAKHKWGAMQAAGRVRAHADRLDQKEK